MNIPLADRNRAVSHELHDMSEAVWYEVLIPSEVITDFSMQVNVRPAVWAPTWGTSTVKPHISRQKFGCTPRRGIAQPPVECVVGIHAPWSPSCFLGELELPDGLASGEEAVQRADGPCVGSYSRENSIRPACSTT
jgi:hypothetical protein